MTESIKDFFLELLLPSFCLGCQKEGILLCQDCQSILEIAEYDYCLCNKNPLRILPNAKNGKCQRCKDKKLSGLYSALPYKEKALTRKLIGQFKYEPYIKTLAKPLSNIILEHFVLTHNTTNAFWENSVLLPIPLDKKKLKHRGYNQAEELAKEMATRINIPVITDTLVKIKATPAQMKLSKEDRQVNLKDAFFIKHPEKIKNKRIFLVDDVYTTGSTIQECAHVLRTSGAKQVFGIVIARES